jgi:DNA-directed RNA polymerase subunit RPC12/RpoP
MKCEKCEKEILGSEKTFMTAMGLLCEDCYTKSLHKVTETESVSCSKCNRLIGVNDFYAHTDEKDILCVNCFKKAKPDLSENKSQSEIASSIGVSHALSYCIYIIGALTIIAGLIVGFASISSNSLTPILYIGTGIISGVILLGLGKIVKAAEVYLWERKQK